MIRTLLAAAAICAVAGPAMAEPTDPTTEEMLKYTSPECLKPVSELNMLQQEHCKFTTAMLNEIKEARRKAREGR